MLNLETNNKSNNKIAFNFVITYIHKKISII